MTHRTVARRIKIKHRQNVQWAVWWRRWRGSSGLALRASPLARRCVRPAATRALSVSARRLRRPAGPEDHRDLSTNALTSVFAVQLITTFDSTSIRLSFDCCSTAYHTSQGQQGHSDVIHQWPIYLLRPQCNSPQTGRPINSRLTTDHVTTIRLRLWKKRKCELIITSCAGGRHNIPPPPVTLIFDLLTLKVVSESRVTWATSVPILVFLCLSVLDLAPMYTRDVRRQTASSLNVPA